MRCPQSRSHLAWIHGALNSVPATRWASCFTGQALASIERTRGFSGAVTAGRNSLRQRVPAGWVFWSARTRTKVLNCAGQHAGQCRSRDLQILRRGLAAIAHEFVFHPLALVEGAQSGAFHGRDMNEDILTAVRRLDEAVAFGGVEPFHVTSRH